METTEQLVNALDLTTGTPYREAAQEPTFDDNDEHNEEMNHTGTTDQAYPQPFTDFASRTPYRCSDLNCYQQLVHLAFGQLPDFQRIDVPIFLQ